MDYLLVKDCVECPRLGRKWICNDVKPTKYNIVAIIDSLGYTHKSATPIQNELLNYVCDELNIHKSELGILTAIKCRCRIVKDTELSTCIERYLKFELSSDPELVLIFGLDIAKYVLSGPVQIKEGVFVQIGKTHYLILHNINSYIENNNKEVLPKLFKTLSDIRKR